MNLVTAGVSSFVSRAHWDATDGCRKRKLSDKDLAEVLAAFPQDPPAGTRRALGIPADLRAAPRAKAARVVAEISF